MSVKTIKIDGITATIDTDAFDDIEVMEKLAEVEETGNALTTLQLVKQMLGAETYEQVKTHYRGENGRTKATDVVNFFAKVMEKAAPNS